MDAGSVCLNDVVVTVGAIGRLHEIGMWLQFRAAVAIRAGERAVNTCGEALWIHLLVAFQALVLRGCCYR
jgi:hypothetical protein